MSETSLILVALIVLASSFQNVSTLQIEEKVLKALRDELSGVKTQLLTIGMEATNTLADLERRHIKESSLPDDIVEQLPVIENMLRTSIKVESDKAVFEVTTLIDRLNAQINEKTFQVEALTKEDWKRFLQIEEFIAEYKKTFELEAANPSESHRKFPSKYKEKIIDDLTLRKCHLLIKQYSDTRYQLCPFARLVHFSKQRAQTTTV